MQAASVRSIRLRSRGDCPSAGVVVRQEPSGSRWPGETARWGEIDAGDFAGITGTRMARRPRMDDDFRERGRAAQKTAISDASCSAHGSPGGVESSEPKGLSQGRFGARQTNQVSPHTQALPTRARVAGDTVG